MRCNLRHCADTATRPSGQLGSEPEVGVGERVCVVSGRDEPGHGGRGVVPGAETKSLCHSHLPVDLCRRANQIASIADSGACAHTYARTSEHTQTHTFIHICICIGSLRIHCPRISTCIHLKTSKGIHLKTSKGIHLKTPKGIHLKTLKNIHLKTSKGIHLKTSKGIHFKTPKCIHLQTHPSQDLEEHPRLPRASTSVYPSQDIQEHPSHDHQEHPSETSKCIHLTIPKSIHLKTSNNCSMFLLSNDKVIGQFVDQF